MKISRGFTNAFLFFAIAAFFFLSSCKQDVNTGFESENGRIQLNVEVTESGQPLYSILFDGKNVLNKSKLGLVMNDIDFSSGLKLVEASEPLIVKDKYQLKTGKKSDIIYNALEKTYSFITAKGESMDVVFQLSDNGVAFRYQFSDASDSIKIVTSEATSYVFPESTVCWLQPMSVAKTGWCETNPSYEEYYEKEIKPGTPSPLKAGWVYPSLFRVDSIYLLVSETGLDRTYCGTKLVPGTDNNEYRVGFPDTREAFTNGNVNPEVTLPFSTPWRIIAIGSLADITESTLGTDLAKPELKVDFSYVKPGIASWSWALLKDNSVNYDVQKQFIDYAADMNWAYCLIDVNWDTQIGYEKIAELADYADSKDVGLILWYNSSGDWNSTTYHPKSKLLTREAREEEFDRIKHMGIKGIKVDFFGGDGQSMINYYLDIFEDASRYGLMVNCHGATLPRGWQRTYPNVVTMESIRGFEFLTFEQANANHGPSHCALLPFTRNVFDPMDFTPMCLYKIPNINRLTTSAFELALPTLFTSGVQHIAETPEGMNTVPDYVKSYLQHLPTKWIQSKLIEGEPAKLAIMAREADDGWYISGINGEKTVKNVSVDLSFIDDLKGMMITDGEEELSFVKNDIDLSKGKKLSVQIKEYGGFVIYFEK
ncbi:MAG: glycoside hydrolase family 97 catalytic domain-containing protein [Marinilabiliaceae bacterium]|nr:glycoside hydrolase family 97 catalytic domain-containing protein [Marinilabiliaceae bacterium]